MAVRSAWNHAMLPRILEPEVMDTAEEAAEYDAMDHGEVNRIFVEDFLRSLRGGRELLPDATTEPLPILDVGTGTALIPIELCREMPGCQVTVVDLSREMLKLAERNVAAAGLEGRIRVRLADAKQLPCSDAEFAAVISNSIVHHIPEPRAVLAEMTRVLRPGGLLFVRDLLRPDDEAALDRLVGAYAGHENAHQQQMFRDSLHAALTLAEVQSILQELGLPTNWATQTSDRHWTVSGVR